MSSRAASLTPGVTEGSMTHTEELVVMKQKCLSSRVQAVTSKVSARGLICSSSHFPLAQVWCLDGFLFCLGTFAFSIAGLDAFLCLPHPTPNLQIFSISNPSNATP